MCSRQVNAAAEPGNGPQVHFDLRAGVVHRAEVNPDGVFGQIIQNPV